jgi:hypothetical protein
MNTHKYIVLDDKGSNLFCTDRDLPSIHSILGQNTHQITSDFADIVYR